MKDQRLYLIHIRECIEKNAFGIPVLNRSDENTHAEPVFSSSACMLIVAFGYSKEKPHQKGGVG